MANLYLARFLAASTICAWFAAAPLGAEETGLQDGDHIVFLGDSITQAGARPGGYVALVREALGEQRPRLELDVIGAGISGNKVPDLEGRLERDVLSKKPTVVVVYIGINDVWHSLSDCGTPAEEFEAGIRRLVERIHASGADVVLCTPSIIGEKHDGSNQLDEMLDKYCEISRTIARETPALLLDLRQRFLDYLRKHNQDNAEKNILTSDGVHLNAQGNRFVARAMLDLLASPFRLPAVKSLDNVTPLAAIFDAADRKRPLTIRSADEAGKYFAGKQLAQLLGQVDFRHQVVLVHAWKGSGQDRLQFDLRHPYPEEVVFVHRWGRSRDLRPHARVFVLRVNVTWENKWRG